MPKSICQGQVSPSVDCDLQAQLNPQPVENMSMLFPFSLFVVPIVVVVLLVGWFLLVDRSGLEDSGGHPRVVKRQERHEHDKIDANNRRSQYLEPL